jgi:hypothetical protein
MQLSMSSLYLKVTVSATIGAVAFAAATTAAAWLFTSGSEK